MATTTSYRSTVGGEYHHCSPRIYRNPLKANSEATDETCDSAALHLDVAESGPETAFPFLCLYRCSVSPSRRIRVPWFFPVGTIRPRLVGACALFGGAGRVAYSSYCWRCCGGVTGAWTFSLLGESGDVWPDHLEAVGRASPSCEAMLVRSIRVRGFR